MYHPTNHHPRCDHRVLILAVFLIALLLCGCQDNPTTSTTEQSQTIPPITYDASLFEPRSDWNLSLSLVEIQEEWIVIEIRDNDNLGFVANDRYLLERQEGDRWIKVSSFTEDELTEYDWYALPLDCGYITSNTMVKKPKQEGHYRVTKYLSDHPVTLEFEIS